MAANARAYFITYKGLRRLVTASGPAVAATHVVGADITELRPASGAEVNQWYRAGHAVDVAGEKDRTLTPGVIVVAVPDPSTPTGQDVTAMVAGSFSTDDARDWLIMSLREAEENVRHGGIEIFDQMARRGTMERHDLSALRLIAPDFVDAIAAGQGLEAIDWAMQDDESIDFQDIVTAVAIRARRDGWVSAAA